MQKMIYLAETDSERDCPLQGVLTLRPSDPGRETALEAAEIIFGNPSIDELHLAKALRWVQMTWAGADRYLGGNFPRNVCLTTASGAFGETIAEHTLAMLLALCRRLPAYIRAGEWHDLGCEKQLCGGTAIIFGCGDLGTRLAQRLKALGVNTIGVCRNARQRREGFDVLTTLECAEIFLPEADFVLCMLPHSAQTAGYFNAARIGLLKQDAIFINVGRGSLADADALALALSAGRLFGVGLDVTAPEPLPQTHPLWTLPNAIITPHIAGVSFGHLLQTEEKIWAICQENFARYQRGEELINEVKLS